MSEDRTRSADEMRVAGGPPFACTVCQWTGTTGNEAVAHVEGTHHTVRYERAPFSLRDNVLDDGYTIEAR